MLADPIIERGRPPQKALHEVPKSAGVAAGLRASASCGEKFR